jgi:hypothetical protein
MPVTPIGGEPGDAAARKLLRSVVMKGLGTAVVESLAAAEAAGCAEWLRGESATLVSSPHRHGSGECPARDPGRTLLESIPEGGGMDIGKPLRIYTIEPVEDPVPRPERAPREEPAPAPRKEPDPAPTP